MIYAVHIFDSASGLQKIVTVEARTLDDAYHRIATTGYRIIRVTPAEPGIAAGVVMNPPATAPEPTEACETTESIDRRRRQEARAKMVHAHNLLALWPILSGIGLILGGLFQWLNGNDRQALFIAVLGVVLSTVGAIRRWTRDQGPWR